MQIEASYVPSLGATGHVSSILEAKNMQKVDKIEPVYFGKYIPILIKKGLWLLKTLSPIGYVHLHQFAYYFSFFFSLTYLLLNCLTHSFLALSDCRYQEGLIQA